jgi:hypothetical protein
MLSAAEAAVKRRGSSSDGSRRDTQFSIARIRLRAAQDIGSLAAHNRPKLIEPDGSTILRRTK